MSWADHEAEAYDSQMRMEEDPNYELPPAAPKTATCKHCKKSGFVWRTTNGKWFLWDLKAEKSHTCLLDAKKKAATEKAKADDMFTFVPSNGKEKTIEEINELARLAALEDLFLGFPFTNL